MVTANFALLAGAHPGVPPGRLPRAASAMRGDPAAFRSTLTRRDQAFPLTAVLLTPGF